MSCINRNLPDYKEILNNNNGDVLKADRLFIEKYRALDLMRSDTRLEIVPGSLGSAIYLTDNEQYASVFGNDFNKYFVDKDDVVEMGNEVAYAKAVITMFDIPLSKLNTEYRNKFNKTYFDKGKILKISKSKTRINYLIGDKSVIYTKNVNTQTNSSPYINKINDYLLTLPNAEKDTLLSGTYHELPSIASNQYIQHLDDGKTIDKIKKDFTNSFSSENISLDNKIRKTIEYVGALFYSTKGLVGKISKAMDFNTKITEQSPRLSPFIQLQKTIIIDPFVLTSLLTNNDVNYFADYIESALLEELIHVKAYEKLNSELIEIIYNELSENDINIITKYYRLNQNNKKLTKSQLVNEYIRQIVQNQLFGKTTELDVANLNNFLKSFIYFLKSLFQDILNIYTNKKGSIGNKTIDEIVNELKNEKTIINIGNELIKNRNQNIGINNKELQIFEQNTTEKIGNINLQKW